MSPEETRDVLRDQREWMLNLSEREIAGLTQHRAMCMRSDIPAFVRTDPGGITPHTVACEMGWIEDEAGAAEEIELVYQVILELVAEGTLVYREGLLRLPRRAPMPGDRWRGQDVLG